nr:hypothetical protein CFP56_03045 [Quercus suber]
MYAGNFYTALATARCCGTGAAVLWMPSFPSLTPLPTAADKLTNRPFVLGKVAPPPVILLYMARWPAHGPDLQNVCSKEAFTWGLATFEARTGRAQSTSDPVVNPRGLLQPPILTDYADQTGHGRMVCKGVDRVALATAPGWTSLCSHELSCAMHCLSASL